MQYVLDTLRYRYGFELDQEKIHAEWLFITNNTTSAREVMLFRREFQEITINKNSFKEAPKITNVSKNIVQIL